MFGIMLSSARPRTPANRLWKEARMLNSFVVPASPRISHSGRAEHPVYLSKGDDQKPIEGRIREAWGLSRDAQGTFGGRMRDVSILTSCSTGFSSIENTSIYRSTSTPQINYPPRLWLAHPSLPSFVIRTSNNERRERW